MTIGRITQIVAPFARVLAGVFRFISSLSNRIKRSTTIVALVATAVLAGHSVSAQFQPPPAPPSLKTVKVPEPDNLGDFIKNKTAAIALGKALFWDMQVGSDGIQSCATCHFHAGTDSRSKNQINPGPDTIFDTGGGPNYQLQPVDYPFHNLTDANNRTSALLKDVNDVTGSQGVFKTKFNSLNPGNAKDNVTVEPDPVFNVHGTNVRQVTNRNALNVINAVFNFRQFWDGRAQNEFNGQNPFGSRDPNATVLKAEGPLNQVKPVKISLKNASLASQAVGPPTNNVEESSDGRQFTDIGQKLSRETGKKLRGLRPLGKQLVAEDDSVLSDLSRGSEPGLKKTYTEMIKAAFQPEWWRSNQIITIEPNKSIGLNINSDVVISAAPLSLSVDLDGIVKANVLGKNQFTQLDYNFPLFFGLAIQLYESTLVSDNAPYDQFQDGKSDALTPRQQEGLDLFRNSGCIFCHAGAEFTAASVTNVQTNGRIAQAPNGAFEDAGFFGIGVTPTQNDLGVGGKDPFGNDLSEARLAQQGKFQQLFGEAPKLPVGPNDTVEADGHFKAPSLRNVELTAPYFHNGGKLTLRQVVDFYSRGGGDDNPSGPPPLPVLNLNDDQKEELVEFLKSLTDDRVRNQSAPFDHPQLFVPNGHPGDQTSVTDDGNGQATDSLKEIPAVGRSGSTPLKNFLE